MSASIGEVSIERLTRHDRAIAQWVRLSGTPDEAKAFDYIARTLDSFGYTVHRYHHPALVGYPQSSRLEVRQPVQLRLPCNGYSLSPATPEEGVEGELVFVGTGLEADYPATPVAGKIVLSDGLAMPPKTVAADRHGVLAQIHINDAHLHEMCLSPVWGTPTPETAPLLPKTRTVQDPNPRRCRGGAAALQGADSAPGCRCAHVMPRVVRSRAVPMAGRSAGLAAAAPPQARR